MTGATKETAAMKDDYMMDRALAAKMKREPRKMPMRPMMKMMKRRHGA